MFSLLLKIPHITVFHLSLTGIVTVIDAKYAMQVITSFLDIHIFTRLKCKLAFFLSDLSMHLSVSMFLTYAQNIQQLTEEKPDGLVNEATR